MLWPWSNRRKVAAQSSQVGEKIMGTINEQIEEAVQVSAADFAAGHPQTYKVLAARLGDPVRFIIDHLERDEAYQALVAQTDEEVDIANIIKVLVPVILKIAETALGIL